MKLSTRLSGMQLFGILADAGIITDPAGVNRVSIEADRGGLVVIHVERLADRDAIAAVVEAAARRGGITQEREP